MVKAKDCQKNRVTGCYKVEPTLDPKGTPKRQGEIKPTKKKSKPTMTKLERKQKHNELKRTLKQEWSIEMETKDTDSGVLSAPSHFKCYTIEERKVILQHPKREQQNPRESYDRPENSKQVNLARENEEPKHVWIAFELEEQEEKLQIETLKNYKDVFAWSYKDLKGVDPAIFQHTIPMIKDAKPTKQRPYTYNDTFAKKIKEEMDKLKDAKFIYEIENTD